MAAKWWWGGREGGSGGEGEGGSWLCANSRLMTISSAHHTAWREGGREGGREGERRRGRDLKVGCTWWNI